MLRVCLIFTLDHPLINSIFPNRYRDPFSEAYAAA